MTDGGTTYSIPHGASWDGDLTDGEIKHGVDPDYKERQIQAAYNERWRRCDDLSSLLGFTNTRRYRTSSRFSDVTSTLR